MLNKEKILLIIKKLFQHGATIYGAGKNGKRVWDIFRSVGIKTTSFIDSDLNKRNTLFVNILVKSPQDIKKHCEEVLVISLKSDSLDAIKTLQPHFSYVIGMNFIDWFSNFLEYSIPNDIEIDSEMNYFLARPFNHSYSPYATSKDFDYRDKFLSLDTLLDIDINEEAQRKFLSNLPMNEFLSLCNKQNARYSIHNDFFSGFDALALTEILLIDKPKKIIEIGSGFSTALILDINEQYRNNEMKIISIEPNPERLNALIHENDNIEIYQTKLQDMSIDFFNQLESGDVLFIDSSHVLKPGSDVLYVLFLIIPKLKSGVIIHIHDISVNFEYPADWIGWGYHFTESYAVRALLMNNQNIKIRFFVSMQHREIEHKWEKYNIGTKKMPCGGSLWLEKV